MVTRSQVENSTSSDYLSFEEAADRLGVDRSTLYRHIYAAVRSNLIKSYKIGSRRILHWPSILAWLDKNAVEKAI